MKAVVVGSSTRASPSSIIRISVSSSRSRRRNTVNSWAYSILFFFSRFLPPTIALRLLDYSDMDLYHQGQNEAHHWELPVVVPPCPDNVEVSFLPYQLLGQVSWEPKLKYKEIWAQHLLLLCKVQNSVTLTLRSLSEVKLFLQLNFIFVISQKQSPHKNNRCACAAEYLSWTFEFTICQQKSSGSSRLRTVKLLTHSFYTYLTLPVSSFKLYKN